MGAIHQFQSQGQPFVIASCQVTLDKVIWLMLYLYLYLFSETMLISGVLAIRLSRARGVV